MADRRLGRGPYVPDEGGGRQPRSRNKAGELDLMGERRCSDPDTASQCSSVRSGPHD